MFTNVPTILASGRLLYLLLVPRCEPPSGKRRRKPKTSSELEDGQREDRMEGSCALTAVISFKHFVVWRRREGCVRSLPQGKLGDSLIRFRSGRVKLIRASWDE